MRKELFWGICLACAVSVCGVAAEPDRNSAVAVMDFGTRPGATTAEININNAEYASSAYMINGLVNRGCFVVMDKDFVLPTLEAEHLKLVGLIDPDSAKRIGEILHVRYIVYGNVASVSTSETGGEIAGHIGGGVNICTVNARIVARIMDVETGDIVAAVKGEGRSRSSYVKVNAGKAALGGVHTLKIGTVTVTMDSVHNAIQKAADDAAARIAAKYKK